MKKFLLILLAILANGQWLMVNGQTVDLTKYTHITSLSQIEEGAYYYIVSDRRKFNYQTGGDGGTDGDKVQIKAMSTYQNGFTAVNWDNPGNNVYFVYYGDLDPKCNGFIWKAEKAGDQWAFLNQENGKYMGHNNPGETDLRFADDAVGFTLTDLNEGEGRWAFTNSDYKTPLNVHQYPLRKSRGVLALPQWSDAQATDADTYGYPGRWHLYKTTVQDGPAAPTFNTTVADKMEKLRISYAKDLTEGQEYYIVSDRTAYAGNTSGKPKAMSTQQAGYTTKWGDQYVYWGDIDTTQAGFVWTVEEMPGDKWAFKNKENGRYLGNMNGEETDVVFSDTPIGYTLSDIAEGMGRFSMVSSDSEYSLHVQGYLRDRANNSLAKQANGNDDYSNDVATNGYPGRWQIFLKNSKLVKKLDDMKEGSTYYIVSDRHKYASSTAWSLRAMSTLQANYTIGWGDQYVYWGELNPKEEGFLWTAEKVGDSQWAFKNEENGRYLGNMNGEETDVVFSGDAVGYTLSDIKSGAGKFSFVNDESEFSLHVQGYLRGGRPDNSLAKQKEGNDDFSSDAATFGYPGRWLLYETTKTNSGGEDPVYDKYKLDTINVVSYNICHCEGTDGKLNLQRTAEVIKSFNPTIVALQEVDKHYSSRSNNEDQVKLLAEATGMYGKFGTAGSNCGNAILSKEKPLSSYTVIIGDRNMVVVELSNYVFAGIHVGLGINPRLKALEAIRTEAKKWEAAGKPFIVAGDLNDEGLDWEVEGVPGLLCDSLVKDFTFHSDRTTPTYYTDDNFVIDHIISYKKIGGVKTLSYEVKNSDASDHYPIMAKLRVGFLRELKPDEVRALIADSVANGNAIVDLSDMTFSPEVTADDLIAPGNTLVYLPEGSTMTGKNIIINSLCQNLELTDGSTFAPVKTFTARKATYQRTMAEDQQWNTVCLPFVAKSDDNVEYYAIKSVDESTLTVSKLTTLPAGTPGLVRKVNGTGISTSFANVRVMKDIKESKSEDGKSLLIGSYTQDLDVDDNYTYYIKDNKFQQGSSSFKCDAFHAYLKMVSDEPASLSAAYEIVIDGDQTTVDSATKDDNATIVGIYSTDGTKRTAVQQGVNIVKLGNGKVQKVVKK